MYPSSQTLKAGAARRGAAQEPPEGAGHRSERPPCLRSRSPVAAAAVQHAAVPQQHAGARRRTWCSAAALHGARSLVCQAAHHVLALGHVQVGGDAAAVAPLRRAATKHVQVLMHPSESVSNHLLLACGNSQTAVHSQQAALA